MIYGLVPTSVKTGGTVSIVIVICEVRVFVAASVILAAIVCEPSGSKSVLNDHDVVPVASENAPPSTDTSTFVIPDDANAVPVT